MRVIHIREVIGITLDINLGRFWKIWFYAVKQRESLRTCNYIYNKYE